MLISRRKLLAGAGSLTAGLGFGRSVRAAPRLQLRLLETSDLHMFVLDWDYYHQHPDLTVGFNKVASLIRQARQEAPNSLLFDNGDLIQGNPLGDYMVQKDQLPSGHVHPMIRAMNMVGYDAATLGNHEFNYGLDFLGRSLAGAAFPFVCANLVRADEAAYVPPFRIIERVCHDEDGVAHPLRIEIIGFVPPQIMTWDKANLDGKMRCDDIVAAAAHYVPILRAQCDVLVALSHSGISAGPVLTGDENASFHLASVPGIDAIMTGHSHRVFPGPDYAGHAGIDAERGTLAGVPAVMPGFWGSHLGVIDLVLAQDGEHWAVTNFAVEARPIYRRDAGKLVSLAAPDTAVNDVVAVEHQATNAWVAEPVGRFTTPVHSFFVFAGYDPASALVNAAQIWYARPLLAETPHAGLPLLSAAAPFKAGFTPDAFIDIPAGPVAIRDIADLYMYPNTLTAVRISGAAVREWLEHATRVFNRIDAAVQDAQPLVDKRVPSYNFDVIAGLSYRIDLTQPARYDFNGRLVNPQAHRIVDLSYDGKPLDIAQDVIVVTNNYRADGGGKFPGLDGSNIVLRAPDSNRDALLRFVMGLDAVSPLASSPWSFAPIGQRVTVTFDSATAAVTRIADVPGLRTAGDGATGFARYELDLS